MAVTGALDISQPKPFDPGTRYCGKDWSENSLTMVGLVRLRNIAQLLLDVASQQIPGDYAELGVWRGGTCIFAKAVLDELGEKRGVHLFDAFDVAIPHYDLEVRRKLVTSPRKILEWFELFGVRTRNVSLHRGLFNDTLPRFHKKYAGTQLKLSVLRIDGNWYDSHQDALFYLYEFVPVGGYVIFDDVMFMPTAREAWDDFKDGHGLTEELVPIDSAGAYIVKTREVKVNFSLMMPARDANL
ncbi:tylF [Symbiodinium natans]|uniref:TylF protein n=1 Tax=Symbiodinium natans TaxID=878477 RepID=A0A812IRI8_9DINO|nr:tylF [Symbiodinium natans]